MSASKQAPSTLAPDVQTSPRRRAVEFAYPSGKPGRGRVRVRALVVEAEGSAALEALRALGGRLGEGGGS
jgi:hypothetical protein